MNKSKLIESVATSAGLTKTDAGKAVDAIIKEITQSLKQGDPVTIIGFGTFMVRKRQARTGRNPRTGEAIAIAASRAPAFKAGKAFKDELN